VFNLQIYSIHIKQGLRVAIILNYCCCFFVSFLCCLCVWQSALFSSPAHQRSCIEKCHKTEWAVMRSRQLPHLLITWLRSRCFHDLEVLRYLLTFNYTEHQLWRDLARTMASPQAIKHKLYAQLCHFGRSWISRHSSIYTLWEPRSQYAIITTSATTRLPLQERRYDNLMIPDNANQTTDVDIGLLPLNSGRIEGGAWRETYWIMTQQRGDYVVTYNISLVQVIKIWWTTSMFIQWPNKRSGGCWWAGGNINYVAPFQ